MDFDKENKVIISTMIKEEAVAFNKFLTSEILRHQRDIDEAGKLIEYVKRVFQLG